MANAMILVRRIESFESGSLSHSMEMVLGVYTDRDAADRAYEHLNKWEDLDLVKDARHVLEVRITHSFRYIPLNPPVPDGDEIPQT